MHLLLRCNRASCIFIKKFPVSSHYLPFNTHFINDIQTAVIWNIKFVCTYINNFSPTRFIAFFGLFLFQQPRSFSRAAHREAQPHRGFENSANGGKRRPENLFNLCPLVRAFALAQFVEEEGKRGKAWLTHAEKKMWTRCAFWRERARSHSTFQKTRSFDAAYALTRGFSTDTRALRTPRNLSTGGKTASRHAQEVFVFSTVITPRYRCCHACKHSRPPYR